MELTRQPWVIDGLWAHSQAVYSYARLGLREGAATVHTYVLAVVEGGPPGSIHMDLATVGTLHHSPHYTGRQASLCSLCSQQINSIA